ncbi:MAG: hypothetical protein ACJAZ2_001130 [Glaciecola sp.]|jgi:hypothetical protein
MKLINNCVYFAFTLSLFLGACSSPMNTGGILVDEIEYAVEIGNPIEQEYSSNWLTKEKRLGFLTHIFDKVKSGELPVYYYITDTMILMEKEYLEDLFHHVDTEYIEVDEKYIKVPIVEDLDLDAVVKLKFLEQWYFDESNNSFYKKVIAICPMMERYKNDKEILGYTGLFWIYLNKD